jgi:hypothetical protein
MRRSRSRVSRGGSNTKQRTVRTRRRRRGCVLQELFAQAASGIAAESRPHEGFDCRFGEDRREIAVPPPNRCFAIFLEEAPILLPEAVEQLSYRRVTWRRGLRVLAGGGLVCGSCLKTPALPRTVWYSREACSSIARTERRTNARTACRLCRAGLGRGVSRSSSHSAHLLSSGGRVTRRGFPLERRVQSNHRKVLDLPSSRNGKQLKPGQSRQRRTRLPSPRAREGSEHARAMRSGRGSALPSTDAPRNFARQSTTLATFLETFVERYCMNLGRLPRGARTTGGCGWR